MPEQQVKAIQLQCGSVEWLEAASEDGKAKPRRFSMKAYTGGPMAVAGFYDPVIVDLAGIDVTNQRRPILYAHDDKQILGHTETIEVSQQRITISGVISGSGPHVDHVIGLAANDFPWQASIGASVWEIERFAEGDSVKVNGRNFKGPVVVARKSTLKESSFVPLGADDNTTAAIAAARSKEVASMEFNDWLKAKGFDPEAISAETKVPLKAMFDADVKAKADADAKTKDAETKNTASTVDIVAKQNELAAANIARIGKIQELAKDHPNIAAQAIKEGWNETKTELEVLRASRANVPAVHVRGERSTDGKVIEASICRTAGMKNLEKHFDAKTLEASERDYKSLGLQQTVMVCAAANGYPATPGERLHAGNIREVLQYATGKNIQASAFSTTSLTTTLGNIANKFLLEGYNEGDQTWREIADVRSVSDFKQATAVRLLDTISLAKLAPDGQIAHGTVAEETYNFQAYTYAAMFALTRFQLINDDLGAFDDLKARMGRNAARKFSDVFWTAFINNSSFYTTALTNYVEGSTTNLGTDGVGLGLGVKTFRKMTSPSTDGTKRIGVGMTPTKLLVPPELEANAQILFQNTNLGMVAGSSANIYANKYRPIIQNRLSESAYTGYSTTAWYLFGDSMNPMVASFLNGQQSPTVESSEVDFNMLGMQFRVYHDFGADKSEYLAGMKSKGAA